MRISARAFAPVYFVVVVRGWVVCPRMRLARIVNVSVHFGVVNGHLATLPGAHLPLETFR